MGTNKSEQIQHNVGLIITGCVFVVVGLFIIFASFSCGPLMSQDLKGINDYDLLTWIVFYIAPSLLFIGVGIFALVRGWKYPY